MSLAVLVIDVQHVFREGEHQAFNVASVIRNINRVSEAARLVTTVPGVRAVHDLPYPARRGRILNTLMWTAQRLPLLDPVRPVLTLLEFG